MGGVGGEQNMACVGGRWVPSIPLKAPIDVRWACDHRWTPHVHPSGAESWLDWDCMRCGAEFENATPPVNGPWRIRSWIAERVWWRRRRAAAAKRMAEWHKQDRCWHCGSPDHYSEGCPNPKVRPMTFNVRPRRALTEKEVARLLYNPSGRTVKGTQRNAPAQSQAAGRSDRRSVHSRGHH